MTHPQSGIFQEDTLHHHHLEFKLRNPELSDEQLEGHWTNIIRIISSYQSDELQIVVGFRPSLWSQIKTKIPYHDFSTMTGALGMTAPSTQNDLWIWIHGSHLDQNFDIALEISAALSSLFEVVLDIQSFVRSENRDLTGFIDGSANPKDDARFEAALIKDHPGSENCSIAFTQQWVHDLKSFKQLAISEQEAVIGRTKSESIELEGENMPDDSHVSRTDVKIDGTALKIYRRSTPYGSISTQGLFFVAFACEQRRIQIQLERMFGLTGDNLHDKIIHFSKAVTGSYWYVPSESILNSLK